MAKKKKNKKSLKSSTTVDGATEAPSNKKKTEKVTNEDAEASEEDEKESHGEEETKTNDDGDVEANQEKTKTTAATDDDDDDESSGVLTNATFASLGLCPALVSATEALKWTYATRVQRDAMPHALGGRDVIGLAETGSGKTGAFALPILQSLLNEDGGRRSGGGVYAVVLAPTRELAFQIHEVFVGLGSSSIRATSVCVVGGVDATAQATALARTPHVVVATPGRLVDHLRNTKGFNLRRLRWLVLDEADRMLSMDFEEEINTVLESVPDSSGGRRTMLFSATMTSKVQKLQRASLSHPVRVEVSTKFRTPDTLQQYYLFVPAKYKDCYLAYLVNEHVGQTILIFAATCNNAQRLALTLRNLGTPAVALHGQMSQPRRLGALNKFKSGQRDVLVCTDVASRGLDVPSVDVVVNYDLPGHGKDYVHRVGRTARAGRSGKALAFVTQYDVEVYQRLEGLLGRKLPECPNLDEETVLLLLERVCEAQRMATRELKEQNEAAKHKRKGKRKRGRYQHDGGMEDSMRSELKRGYDNAGRRSRHSTSTR